MRINDNNRIDENQEVNPNVQQLMRYNRTYGHWSMVKKFVFVIKVIE